MVKFQVVKVEELDVCGSLVLVTYILTKMGKILDPEAYIIKMFHCIVIQNPLVQGIYYFLQHWRVKSVERDMASYMLTSYKHV